MTALRVIFADEEIEDVLRQIFGGLPFLLLLMQLESNQEVAFVGLTIKLVGDGVESRVFSGVMFSVALEKFVRRFQGLLGKEAERERRKTK